MTEKKFTFTYFVTRIVVVIMVLLLLWQGIYSFTDKVLVDKLNIRNQFTYAILDIKETGLPEGVKTPKRVSVNWMMKYPDVNMLKYLAALKNNSQNESSEENKAEQKNLKYYLDYVSASIKSVNTSLKSYADKIPDNIIFADYINQAGSKYNSIIGWEIPDKKNENNIVSLGDGYYAYTMAKGTPTKLVENLVEFRDYLAKSDIPLVYVAAPRKIFESDTRVSGVIDYSAQIERALLEMLEEKNIDYVDVRQHIIDEFEDPHEAFFKTDLHWKPQTGLFAAGLTAEYLNSKYGYNIDMTWFDNENFSYELYESRILGSEGRKLTVSVAEPEDFMLLYPKKDVKFSVSVPDIDKNETGDFSVFYDYSQVLGNIEYYDRMAYETYMFGGNALWEIKNLNNPEGKKVLMLCDSFGRTYAPFFSLGVRQLDVLDLRKFSGSLKTYMNCFEDFDAVIIVYNPGAYNDKNLIDFS